MLGKAWFDSLGVMKHEDDYFYNQRTRDILNMVKRDAPLCERVYRYNSNLIKMGHASSLIKKNGFIFAVKTAFNRLVARLH